MIIINENAQVSFIYCTEDGALYTLYKINCTLCIVHFTMYIGHCTEGPCHRLATNRWFGAFQHSLAE